MSSGFRAYIEGAPVTDTGAGDFIADAKQDATLPDAATWAELRDYLKTVQAPRSAIKAALDVWRQFDGASDRDAARTQKS